MRWWFLVIAAVGCYGPAHQAGAPCTGPGAVCPFDEVCTLVAGQYECATTATMVDGGKLADASIIDGHPLDPMADEDGDGVKNGVDNCPLIANVDQHNEDGDPYGDQCDPCPIVNNSIEVDTDTDGVGDSCDPHPNSTGDAVWKFETFKNGVPNAGGGWDPFGTWTAASDSISTSVTANHANMGYTMPSGAHETLWAGATITASGAMDLRGGGLVDQKGGSTDGVGCYIYLDAAGAAKLGIVHASTSAVGGTELASTPFSWTVNTHYQLVLTRDTTSYTCRIGATTVTVVSGITNSPPELGFAISNSAMTFDYLFVVMSPN